MLFKKIHFPQTPNNPEPHSNWYMILRTQEEVLRYFEVDSWKLAWEMFSPKNQSNLSTSHLKRPIAGIHADTVGEAILELAKNSLKEGEKMWPHEVYATHLNKKGMAMMKHLQYGPVQVNEAGGYCGHESFLRTWPDARVVKEIEQENLTFPEKDRGKVAGQKFGF